MGVAMGMVATMSPSPMELARRGDLVLVCSATSPAAGLCRDDGEALRPAGKMDADEWWWVLHCAAPLAVRACPRTDRPAVES